MSKIEEGSVKNLISNDDQKIIAVGTETDINNIKKEDKLDFDQFKQLYTHLIDSKCIADYGSIEDKDLWEDAAKDLFLQTKMYIPSEEDKPDKEPLETRKVEESKELTEGAINWDYGIDSFAYFDSTNNKSHLPVPKDISNCNIGDEIHLNGNTFKKISDNKWEKHSRQDHVLSGDKTDDDIQQIVDSTYLHYNDEPEYIKRARERLSETKLIEDDSKEYDIDTITSEMKTYIKERGIDLDVLKSYSYYGIGDKIRLVIHELLSEFKYKDLEYGVDLDYTLDNKLEFTAEIIKTVEESKENLNATEFVKLVDKLKAMDLWDGRDETFKDAVEKYYSILDTQSKLQEVSTTNKITEQPVYDNKPSEQRYKELIEKCFDWIDKHISADDYNHMLDDLEITPAQFDSIIIDPAKYERVLTKALIWIMDHTSDEKDTINNQLELTPEEIEFFGVTFDSDLRESYTDKDITNAIKAVSSNDKGIITDDSILKPKLQEDKFFNLYKSFDDLYGINKMNPKELIEFFDDLKKMNRISDKDYNVMIDYANNWQSLIDKTGYMSTTTNESKEIKTEDQYEAERRKGRPNLDKIAKEIFEYDDYYIDIIDNYKDEWEFVKDNIAEVAAEYNLKEQAAEEVMRKIYSMAKQHSKEVNGND